MIVTKHTTYLNQNQLNQNQNHYQLASLKILLDATMPSKVLSKFVTELLKVPITHITLNSLTVLKLNPMFLKSLTVLNAIVNKSDYLI